MPWHDPALSMEERLSLAEEKPVARRLMAAMAQLDCGACGYACQTYAEAIASGEEKDLTKCAPGGRETAKKLKGAKTDSDRVITFDPDHRPEVANLLTLIGLCEGVDPAVVAEEIGDGGGGALKGRLTDAINTELAPLRARRAELAAGGLFVPRDPVVLRWQVDLTPDRLRALFASFPTWARTPGAVDKIAAAAEECGPVVTEHYLTAVYVADRA